MIMSFVPPKGFFIGSLEIRFYGVIMAIAMLVGVLLASRLAKKRNIKPDDIIMLALIVLPCAIVGARLYYCIFEYHSLAKFFMFKEGGMAVLGGVLGGIIGIIIFALIKKNFKILLDLLDICAPCLILGQAIGRIGCYFSQCCYGIEVTNPSLQWFPFAVLIERFEGSGIYDWHLATMLYESVWNFIGFALVLMVYKKSNSLGDSTASYLAWYGLGRAVIEGFRGDSLFIGNSPIRVSQLLSIIMIIVGVVILSINIYKRKKKLNG